MLTKSPNAEEVRKFTQMIGMFPFKQLVMDPLKTIGAILKQATGIGRCALVASMLRTAQGSEEVHMMTCVQMHA